MNTAISDLIEERGQETIYEVLDNFAGITSQSNNSDTGSNVARSIFVRGFDIAGDGPILVNDLRLYSTGANFRSTAALERVELPRGAAGFYYGASQPGGILSYVYKWPLEYPRTSLRARADSEGSFGLTLDDSGPLNAANTLRYRVVADGIREESDVDWIYEEPVGVMVALEWDPAEAFQLNFTLEHSKTAAVPQRTDNILVGGGFLDVPCDFFWGHTDDFVDITQTTALLEADWQARDWLALRGFLAYQAADQEHQTTKIGGRGSTPSTPDAVSRIVHVGESEDEALTAGLDASGTLATGRFSHAWLLGYSYSRGEGEGGVAQCATGTDEPLCAPIAPAAVNPDVFDPFDYPYTDAIFGLIGTQRSGIADTIATDHNFYAQTLTTLPNGATKVLLGLGYGYAERESRAVRSDTGEVTESALDAEYVTPRVAFIHDLTPTTSVYASYSESYLPQLQINPDGEILDEPEIGRQYEIGLKRSFLEERVLATFATYQLDREDVLRADPDPNLADLGYQVSDGLQRARGFEFELVGAVTERWDARLAYAYTHTEIVRSETGEGNRFPYISDHSLSLWNRYAFAGDVLGRGEWSLGAGLTAYSDFEDSDGNELDGYGIADIGLFYERELRDGTLLQAAARVENLFDKTFYDRRSSIDSITYGNGRRVSLSVETIF